MSGLEPMPDSNPGQTSAPSVRPLDVTDAIVCFALIFALTTPIWVLSAALDLEILPGLPIAGVAVVCPALAALIVLAVRRGAWRSLAFLKRGIDPGRSGSTIWWALALLLSPALSVLAFLVLRMNGADVPAPYIAGSGALALFALFLVGAISEELGWSAFALDPLQARWGAAPAALLIGLVWAFWHYPALIQAHRSLSWIAWWTLGTLASRFVLVWMFNGTGGGVLCVAVFHAMSNLCWQLFPVHGSWFDPRLHGLFTSAAALAICLATLRQYGVYKTAAGERRLA